MAMETVQRGSWVMEPSEHAMGTRRTREKDSTLPRLHALAVILPLSQ